MLQIAFLTSVISGRRDVRGAGDEAPVARLQRWCINYHLQATNVSPRSRRRPHSDPTAALRLSSALAGHL